MDDVVTRSFATAARPDGTQTFRVAGTSLNGQSKSDDCRHLVWRQVENSGLRVRAGAGMILGHVNAV
jgi:hypothetical protein